jgi:hypothetical protein
MFGAPSLRPLLMLRKPKSTPAYRAAYKVVYSSTVSYESPGQDQEELERILQQAELTGDNLLARGLPQGDRPWYPELSRHLPGHKASVE